MKSTCGVLLVLYGIGAARGLDSEDIQTCLNSEEDRKKQSSLLQVHQGSKFAQSAELKPGNLSLLAYVNSMHTKVGFTPAHGNGGNLAAIVPGECAEDSYEPSMLESAWFAHAAEWTKDEDSLCTHFDQEIANDWIHENMQSTLTSDRTLFSRLCKKGMKPQLLEPLAGVLRDPRVICQPFDEHNFFGIDWLVMADKGAHPSASGKHILFDAGGTRFMDAMQFFTRAYERRGIQLDQIYAWEYVPQGTEAYWEGTPPDVRAKWEPVLKFYDGIPVTADPDSHNNPVKRILEECKPEDFCSFKLDIDTPSVEFPIIEQILGSPKVASVLDEFFFEHHVHGVMEEWGWDKDVNGTFEDSYNIFTRLRQMGIRAHSWI